ncbi:hypothetical protein CSUI_008413 [Cystoisospora suis]|uniref:Uncharacterized protein n=1 Tax=Cystoisospora suis TaxID=483139 RepID=A0A2C6KMQ5_9APIC|nr:hypothetical protein CSUI_008413 [Cystoisospora suis]
MYSRPPAIPLLRYEATSIVLLLSLRCSRTFMIQKTTYARLQRRTDEKRPPPYSARL